MTSYLLPHALSVNTLPLGHTEMCDCYLVRCWRVTHFYVFLDILHVRCRLVWFTYRFKVIVRVMQDAWVSSYKQTIHDPLFLEPFDCNKGTTHSDTLYIFLQLQSWLCVGMFCNRTVVCVSYVRIHVLMSLFIVTVTVCDSDDPTTSSDKQLWSSTGPLTPQFPHPFSLTSLFITV
jgi:hypothetical protein